MKIVSKNSLIISVLIIGGILIGTKLLTKKKQTQVITNLSNNNKIHTRSKKINHVITFAGEIVPLNNPLVKKRIDKELVINANWKSNGKYLIRRTYKYFPIIEPILKKYNVPDDFKYLAVAESGLQNVTSSEDAKGVWQLLKPTAIEYGLVVNKNIDERFNIEKATKAVCKYFLNSKRLFDSWTLAAAAYNAGNRGIAEKINSQKVHNYYKLRLDKETESYIPRIIVVKEILTHLKKYGYHYDEHNIDRQSIQIFKIDTVISNLSLFAAKHGTSYKILKRYNPWLLENKLDNRSHRIYFIKIPK